MTNPFEPNCTRCKDTGRIVCFILNMPSLRDLPDAGTPIVPGRDIEVSHRPCPQCTMKS